MRGVRLIDGVADAARDHIDVLVEGERIASVRPHDPELGRGSGQDRGCRGGWSDAAPRVDRCARPLHIRPDRGLAPGDHATFGCGHPRRCGRPCGTGVACGDHDGPRRGLDPEPRVPAPRRDRGWRGRWAADRGGGHSRGRHRRSRVGVRAGSRRTRWPGRGHAGGRESRRRRREGRGLGSRDAHHDGPRPGSHGPRCARADAGGAAGRS